ncbi:MAG: Hpt domain-containing protein [Spongiibacteraceae bacterium]
MAKRRDYIALDWVAEEISVSLNDCVSQLRSYLRDPSQQHFLLEARECLHDVQGSLRMIEFNGEALLVSEMESALAFTDAGGVSDAQIDAVTAVIQAADELPAYLNRERSNQRQLPVSLMMIFNDLRAANKQALVSSGVLFLPHLDLDQPLQNKSAQLTDSTYSDFISKLSKMYEIAADAYLRGADATKNLGYLRKVCSRAMALCGNYKQWSLWSAAEALVEGLANESIVRCLAIESILARLGGQFDSIATETSTGDEEPKTLSLLKDILFYVACSQANSLSISKLRERHKLSLVLADEAQSPSEENAQALRHIRDEIVAQLQSLAANDESSSAVTRCFEIRDSLAILGYCDELYALSGILHPTETGDVDFQLLSSLADSLSQANHDVPTAALFNDDIEAQEQLDRALRSLIDQSRKLIADIQESILSYVAENWRDKFLREVPEQLIATSAALKLGGFPAPAEVLDSCASYIADDILDRKEKPEWLMLDALADAIAAVDYFLERSASGPVEDADGLLYIAEQCVTQLGYPVNTPPRLLQRPSEERKRVEPQPIADALEQDPEDQSLALDPDILAVFLEEAEEILELLQDVVPKWRRDFAATEHLAEVRRGFHTLKGSGRMVMAGHIAELSWAIENMLNKVVDGHYVIDDARLVVVEKAERVIPLMLEKLANGGSFEPEYVYALQCRAEQLTAEQLPETDSLAEHEAVHGVPSRYDESLLSVFLSEADTHLLVIDDYLAEVDSYPASLNDELQRSLHTLKGASRMADLNSISDVITPLEELVKELRSMRVSAGENLINLIADVSSYTRQQLADLRDGGASSLAPKGLLRRINTLSVQLIHDAEFAAASSESDWLPAGALDEFLAVCAEQLQTLMDFSGTSELAAADLSRRAECLVELAERAETVRCEGFAELARESKLFAAKATEPLGEAYLSLFNEALDQLMEFLNQLAAEQQLVENAALLEKLRRFEVVEVVEVDSATEESTPLPVLEVDEEIDPEIVEIFLEEAADLLESLDQAIHDWSADRSSLAPLDDLQRYLHTLKGGARMAGLRIVGDLSHGFEAAIVASLGQGTNTSDEFYGEVHLQQDKLVAAVARATDGNYADEAAETALETLTFVPPPEAIEEVKESLPVSDNVDLPDTLQMASQIRAPQEMVKVPSPLLESLINLAGETSIARSRAEEQLNDINFSLDEMETTVERLQDQVRRLNMETEAQIAFRQEQVQSEGADGFDPLEFDRYSQLQQLSRSLLESGSDLVDLRSTLLDKSRDMETLLLQQSRINTELQEGLMHSQMVSFARMVPRLRRGIRQLSGELNKPVDFRVFNAEGEMDRRVLERIIPALEHLLRNALDHGAEAVEQRREAGKPDHATIEMRFDRQGGDVVIVISDDGGGIDVQAVRSKAEKLELVASDTELSEGQLLDYIFHPGFSTASSVTQISGRGVGLDVVRSEIKQLGGVVEVSTERGRGTRFEIRLPFTVSVNRALMVAVAGEIYAVPLNNIEGIVRVNPYELDVYYQDESQHFEYADKAYKLRYMGQLLNSSVAPKLDGQVDPKPVLLIRNADPVTAIQVDSLLGSHEVVVKTLGPQFAGVQGLSGATVMGDGSVVVILDMLASIRAFAARDVLPHAHTDVLAAESATAKMVMVVDDSVTVRKVTARLLERQQINVTTARDGLEAVTMLQEMEQLPDVILLDIEMPRMDGFEVLGRMRNNPRLQDIPVIVISSRTGEKHRQRARSLGVTSFLGKPYQEVQLLGAINHYTAGLEEA